MPQKKPKKAKAGERHPVTLRFNDNEMAALNTDRRQLGGIPVSVGAYAKHAVVSYPKLRKLDESLRQFAIDPSDRLVQQWALKAIMAAEGK